MDVAAGQAESLGDFTLGVPVGKQQEGGLLLGGEHSEGGFKIELGEDLVLRLVSQMLPDLKLGRAEGLGPLLDLVQIKETQALAQRRIPSRDPDRRRLQNKKAQIPMDLSLCFYAPDLRVSKPALLG